MLEISHVKKSFGKNHVLTVPVVFLSQLFIRNVVPDWL